MHLTPREIDKLLIFVAAEVARRRRERGLKLNYPEAMALISAEILEGARDGKSVAELMRFGKQILQVRAPYRDRVDTEDGTPPNVSALVAEATVEGLRAGHYWDGWEDKHDYVMVLHTAADSPNPDPELLTLLAEGHGFQLYAIQR